MRTPFLILVMVVSGFAMGFDTQLKFNTSADTPIIKGGIEVGLGGKLDSGGSLNVPKHEKKIDLKELSGNDGMGEQPLKPVGDGIPELPNIPGCSEIGPSTLRYGNSQYYVNPGIFRENWISAVEFCIRKGMKLVSLESEEELDAVWKWIYDLSDYDSNNHRWWTSGSKLGNDKDFIWHSTGQLVNTFGKWQKLQPNDYHGIQKCVQFWCHNSSITLYYDDTNCQDKIFAICEKKIDETCDKEIYAIQGEMGDDGKYAMDIRESLIDYPELQ